MKVESPAGQESHERRADLMNVQEISDDDRSRRRRPVPAHHHGQRGDETLTMLA